MQKSVIIVDIFKSFQLFLSRDGELRDNNILKRISLSMYVIATFTCPHFHFSIFSMSLFLNRLFETDSHSNEYLVGHTIASRNIFTHAEGHLVPNRAVKRLRHDASRPTTISGGEELDLKKDGKCKWNHPCLDGCSKPDGMNTICAKISL